MKRKLRDSSDSSFETELDSDEDTEWPAAVRRLAAKVQPGRRTEARKARTARLNDDQNELQGVARFKPRELSH